MRAKPSALPIFRYRRAAPRVGLGLSLVLFLSGCTVGPEYQAPAAPSVPRFTEQPLPNRTAAATTPAGTAQEFATGRDIPGAWWELFHSPDITALVQRALQANPDVIAARATLREARENLRAEQGSLFPQLSTSASRTRSRESLSALGFGSGSETYSNYSAALNFSYTLDTFGGIRRQVEQLGAQAEYEREELAATDLTLSANVVTAAITEASLRAQIDTTQAIIRTYTDALNLTRRRFELGGVSGVDVLQQQTLLDAQIANLPGLRKQLQQTRNQLAVYVGTQPALYSAQTIDLAALHLPPELPVSLPSRLVEQRPDIRATAALLHAATANVGVATANTLPQISLSASYGRNAGSFADLFTPAGIVWSIAASISQPIFDGGTLQAKKRAAIDAMEVAAAQYSSTVNTAFEDVANSLVAIQRDAETLRAALESQQTAAKSLAVAQAQYSAGGGTYLNVLTAEQSDQSARLNVVTAQAARFTDTVALFQALGGGWWNRDTQE